MLMNNILEIYKMIKKELIQAPDEESQTDEINDMYADMQNLKESIEIILPNEIKKEENKENERVSIIEKIEESNKSFLFKGIANNVVSQLEILNEEGRNIKFNINDVKEITEKILKDDYFYNTFINTISDAINERVSRQEKEVEEEM